jgi:hypothetical protein
VAEGKRILGGVQVEGDEAAAVGFLLERLGLGELRGEVVIGDAAFAERRVAQRVLDKGCSASQKRDHLRWWQAEVKHGKTQAKGTQRGRKGSHRVELAAG